MFLAFFCLTIVYYITSGLSEPVQVRPKYAKTRQPRWRERGSTRRIPASPLRHRRTKMRLHSSQRKRTGPSCWPKGRMSPAVLETCRLLSKRRRSRRSWSQRIADGRKRRRKCALSLTGPLRYRAVLHRTVLPAPVPVPVPATGPGYPVDAAAHGGNVFDDGDDERPSTSTHIPKCMRACERPFSTVVNWPPHSTGPGCPTAMRFTCCQLQHGT